ncbi:MAG: hypothetical protein Q8910_00200 [Bacteroidota bacterium]|nr:hypothetical protein [Bacteroidota bacterium]
MIDMKIQIKETGEVAYLTIRDKNGVDWAADLITAGGMEHNDDRDPIMTNGDYEWWKNYINDHDQTDDDIEDLLSDLEDVECPFEYGWRNYVNEMIGNNTGNDYEYHRKEAIEAMNEIREEFLK